MNNVITRRCRVIIGRPVTALSLASLRRLDATIIRHLGRLVVGLPHRLLATGTFTSHTPALASAARHVSIDHVDVTFGHWFGYKIAGHHIWLPRWRHDKSSYIVIGHTVLERNTIDVNNWSQPYWHWSYVYSGSLVILIY